MLRSVHVIFRKNISNYAFCRSGSFSNSKNCMKKCPKILSVMSTSRWYITNTSLTSKSPQFASSTFDRYVFPEPPEMISVRENENVIEKVNGIMKDPGRLFAIVTIAGVQHKITAGDIVRVNRLISVECGDHIRLEKVCLVGGEDFTLVGKPVLPRRVVKVLATVIEKTPGEDLITKRFIRRKRYERTSKFNVLYTILRINKIEVTDHLE